MEDSITAAWLQYYNDSGIRNTCYEWRYSVANPTPPTEPNQWKTISDPKKLRLSNDNLEDREIIKMATRHGTYPMTYATDGGYAKLNTDLLHMHKGIANSKTGWKTAACCVLLQAPDYTDYESWCNAKPNPILIRINRLPQYYGTEHTHNAHAELMALCHMLEMHPIQHICFHIGDSQTERDRMLQLREPSNIPQRILIRSVLSGTSTGLGKRLHS